MKSVYISGLTYIMCTGAELSGPCTRRGGSPYANGVLSRRLEGGKERKKEKETDKDALYPRYVRSALTRTFMKYNPLRPLSLTGTEPLIFADRNCLSICYRALFVKSNQGLARRVDK